MFRGSLIGKGLANTNLATMIYGYAAKEKIDDNGAVGRAFCTEGSESAG